MKIFYTEEGIPVRTLYIPNVSINITNHMLCEYFRQFGAIERVQIVPERLTFFDILPAIGTTGFVDQPPSERKYFAYVTFVNALGAAEALNTTTHDVQHRTIQVEQAFSWNQPASEIDTIATKKPEPIRRRQLFDKINESMDNDCILKVMSYLDIFELSTMAKFNQRFQTLAQHIRCLRIFRPSLEKSVTLMELRNILRLLGFGHSVTNFTISLKSFCSSEQHHVCDRLFQYIGPQLKSLTLLSFSVKTQQFELMKPLLSQLTYLDIDLNYSFDYKQFNCSWPNLQTLRIRSSGSIHLFCTESSITPPEFPKLKSLMIASGYKLHENIFERTVTASPTLRELVVINIDDYYTELSPNVTTRTDLEKLSELQHLVKLHLSFSRTYFYDLIVDTIAELRTLEHLTLEITNVRQTDDRLIAVLNRDLKKIATSLPRLKVIRLSGVTLADGKIVEMVQFAQNLHTLCIHACNLELSTKLISALVAKRRAFFNTIMGAQTPKKLTLIVDEFSDELILCQLSNPDIKQYLIVQRNTNKNIINKDYIICTDAQARPVRAAYRRVRNINERMVNERMFNERMHNDRMFNERAFNDPRERERELHRLRNRMFLFRPCHGSYLPPIDSKAVLKSRLQTVTRDELFSLEDSLPQVSFVAALNLKYVSVKQGVDVTANQDEIGEPETVQKEYDWSARHWALRTTQDCYWCLSNGAGIQATGNRRCAVALFEMVWHGDGSVPFRVNNGKFLAMKLLKCESTTKLECNKATYETILVERSQKGVVFFKGQNNKYWRLEGDGISVDGDAPHDGFYLELREPTRICIRSTNGHYLGATKNGTFKLCDERKDSFTQSGDCDAL